MIQHITTPFGRRTLTPAQIQAQANAATCPDGVTVHKWSVFRNVAAARRRLRLTDRAVAVLDALLTFHPETVLRTGEGADLVVYPSNAALALRAHGIAEATLRRALAALVETGLIIRKDSPNGKRYVRREQGGAVAQAYGFDLSPLVSRSAELADVADQIRAEALALRVSRERVTLLRRDCAKLIVAIEEAECALGAAEPLRTRYASIVAELPRQPNRFDLENAAEALNLFAGDLSILLLAHQKSTESIGTPDQDDRHIQSSKTETLVYEPATEIERKEASAEHRERVHQAEPSSTRGTYPLGLVIDACPDITDYARDGVRSWRDLTTTADFVRSLLGISPDAWREAREVMGDDAAAVTVAAILQRAEYIKSPGGYLRALVDRKRAGKFSLGPMLQALHRTRLGGTVPRPAAG